MAKEESILSYHQKKFLNLISQEKYFTQRFYLTGGTALAEFYLKHRISEDLDFFSETQEVNPIFISRFLKIRSKRLGIEKFGTRQVLGLYSLFLHFEDRKVLKTDFSYYPFPRIEKGVKHKNIEVDSILDIAVNKVHTISMMPRARDFIDVYFIVKEKGYDFHDLLMKAKAKFDWHIDAIQLGSRLFLAKDVKDYPRMLKKIDHREWKGFFINQAKGLKKGIFK